MRFLFILFSICISEGLQASPCADYIRRIIVADPVSAGAEMASWLISQGHHVGALFTLDHHRALEPAGPREMRGFASIIDESQFPVASREVHRLLYEFGPQAILAGTDTAAGPTATWNDIFGLPGNPPALIRAFREKDEQAALIAAAHLRSMHGFRSHDYHAMREWIHREQGQDWLRSLDDPYPSPIRLKPIDGAGGISHAVVKSDRELRDAVLARIGQPTAFGQAMHSLLAQPNLSPDQYDEYIVETVTSSIDEKGRPANTPLHKQAFFYRYQKCRLNDGIKTLNQVLWLLPPEGRIQTMLADFANASVTAFQTRAGPTHGEFFLAKNGNEGPIFNEMGFRPGGLAGYLRKVALLATGLDEFELIYASHFDRQKFESLAPKTYRPAAIVKGVSRDGSRPISHAIGERIRQLPGFVELKWKVDPGTRLLTDDTLAIAYLAVFVHDDESALQRSVQQVLDWERDGLLYADIGTDFTRPSTE